MRWVAIMALTATALAGCGGSSRDARDEVADYIREATKIQQRFASSITKANEAYQAFTRSSLDPAAAEAQLASAERAIRAAGEPLAGLEPPREARALHSKVLRLYDMNVAFAAETTALARYLPASERALAPLDRANRRLRNGLGSARSARGQVRVLRRFVAQLRSVLAELRALKPPTVLLPPHGDQIRNLDATRAAAGRLATALSKQDARRVARLVKSFRRSLSARRPRTRLANQAIDEYNRRYRQLLEAQADVRREEGRLDRTLD